jgi:hypothetical protein
VAALEVIPRGRHVTASLTRRGAAAAIVGIVVLSMVLFTNAPLPILALVTLGGLSVLAGAITGVVIALLSPFRRER